MKSYCRTVIAVIAVSTCLASPPTAAAESPYDLVVFVNKGHKINSITIDELQQFYLKTKNNWSNGKKAICINTQESNPARKIFRSKVLKMTKEEESVYWENQKIRFHINPCIEMMNVARAVFNLRTAVGYALRRDVPHNVVKIILTIPE
jgi:hypothetical protein